MGRSNKPSVFVGETYSTNHCGDVEILAYNNALDVTVKFLNTGWVKSVNVSNMKRGRVEDVYAPLVKGVGFLGEGAYKPKVDGRMTKCHSVWFQILRRCYDVGCKGSEPYEGRGVTVCKEWHNYQNFAAWYYQNYKEGMQIDKDIVNQGAKEYNPENCRFIPLRVNTMLTTRRSKRGFYPIGVQKTASGKYTANMSNGKSKGHLHLGTHNTMHQAFCAYKEAKESLIKSVAEEYYSGGLISKDVYDGLISWEVTPYP